MKKLCLSKSQLSDSSIVSIANMQLMMKTMLLIITTLFLSFPSYSQCDNPKIKEKAQAIFASNGETVIKEFYVDLSEKSTINNDGFKLVGYINKKRNYKLYFFPSVGEIQNINVLFNVKGFVTSMKSEHVSYYVSKFVKMEEKFDFLIQEKNGKKLCGTGYIVTQNTNKNEDFGFKEVYSKVDEMPEFIGGQSAMYDFLSKNIRYPKTNDSITKGKVVVQFIVDENGNITDTKIVRSLKKVYDLEVLRVVSLMPKWKPGKLNGKNASVYYTLPVNFMIKE